MNRLCNQYETVDMTAFTDRLTVITGNIENSMIALGAKPGIDYNIRSLVKLAISAMSLKEQDMGALTLENILLDNKPSWARAVDAWVLGAETLTQEEIDAIYLEIKLTEKFPPTKYQLNSYLLSMGRMRESVRGAKKASAIWSKKYAGN